MTGYDNVLVRHPMKTSAKLRAAGGAKLRSKQRKWRVFLSIGLLLPALAAIIGIVAWAISVEVANGSQNALGSTNYRKPQQQQQAQQLQQKAAQQQESLYQQFRRQQQQAGERPERDSGSGSGNARMPVAAAVVGQRPAAARRRSEREEKPVKETKSESVGASNKQQQLNNANELNERQQASSALLLTNLDQVEALSGSTTTARPPSAPTTSTEADEASPTEQALPDEPATENEAAMDESLDANGGEQRSGDETADANDGGQVVVVAGDRDEDEDEPTGASGQTLLVAKTKQASTSAPATPPNSSKSENHKSRWTNTEKTNNNKKPVKVSNGFSKPLKATAAGAADGQQQLKLAKQQVASYYKQPFVEGGSAADRRRKQLAGRLNKSKAKFSQASNRYVIVDNMTGGDDMATRPESGEQSLRTQRATTSMSSKSNSASQLMPYGSGGSSVERRSANEDNRSNNGRQVNGAPAIVGRGRSYEEAKGSLLPSGAASYEQHRPAEAAQTGKKAAAAAAAAALAASAEDELNFEAIASAISTTLSAASDAQLAEEERSATGSIEQRMAPTEGDAVSLLSASPDEQGGPPLEGDTGLLQAEPASEESRSSSRHSPALSATAAVAAAAAAEAHLMDAPEPQTQAGRRRTTGEHVAEVIDHIVERRKQSAGRSAAGQLGTQIVVVAPVGGSGMKARSLTRASEQPALATDGGKFSAAATTTAAGKLGQGSTTSSASDKQGHSKAAIKKQPVFEDKRIVSALKKDASSSFGAKKGSPLLQRRNKPIGARLLGNPVESVKDLSASLPQIKFSERVEVIEDDDSSSFLMKNLQHRPHLSTELMSQDERDDESPRLDEGEQQPQQALLKDSPAMLLDSIGEQSSIHVSSQPGEARSRSPRHEMRATFERYARQFAEPQQSSTLQQQQQQPQQQPKLYSAEQLIRDHVLKSKTKSRPSKPINQQEPIVDSERGLAEVGAGFVEQNSSSSQQQSTPIQQVKVPPTTARPSQNGPASSISITTESNSTTRDKLVRQQSSLSSNLSSPRQERLLALGREQVGGDIQQAHPSGIRSVQVPMFIEHKQAPIAQAQSVKQADTYQAVESQQSAVQYQPAPSQQQQQQTEFAGSNQQQNEQYQQQEQQQISSSQQEQQQIPQQPALPVFADQEYNVPAHMAESVIHEIQRSQPTIGMVNNQPTLVSLADQVPYLQQQQQQRHQQLQYQQPSSSDHQALYRLASQQQAWQNQAAAANLMARLANVQQQEHYLNQQQQSQAQRQVLANRNGVESPTKAARSSIVHPMAQLALRHLLNSLGQQQASAVAAARQQAGANEPRARSMAAPINSINQVSHLAPTEALQGAGSAPASSAVLPSISGPISGAPTADIAPTGRSMRSLPIGDKLPAGQVGQDQEVQESYGQMPTYHMPAGYGGGAGPSYGGDYQSEHDKKSKGVTFHFGGGPIGGGTQLITSPMGIFKHLMIPLLPNPRINLNGKVVFGVVLEKNTAIGEPKKKYKFWGR